MMGIGKRALLEDYYLDELPAIFGEYGALRSVDREPRDMEMSPLEFLGAGGEQVGA